MDVQRVQIQIFMQWLRVIRIRYEVRGCQARANAYLRSMASVEHDGQSGESAKRKCDRHAN